jgi:outer membrane protein assembly factor BamB
MPLTRLYPLTLLCISVILCMGADWRQFRGTHSNSVAADANLPVNWSADENVAWKSPLPGRAASSPIIVGKQVYVTRSGGVKQDRLYVLSFDTETGKQMWRREFWATGRTYTHPTSSVAAPTPASDGKRIVAFYSSNDLACLDLDGNLLWYRGLGLDFDKAGNDVGMSSSPVIADGVVIVQAENQGNSFATGISLEDGRPLWKTPRPAMANWASPIIVPGPSGKPAVILQSPGDLKAHDVQTGKELWNFTGGFGTITSATLSGELLLLNSGGMTALRIGLDITTPDVYWSQNRLSSNGASPVVHDGKVYVLSGSIAKCGDLQTGELLWQSRLEGRFWASPILAGGHLYYVNQEGLGQVLSIAEEGKIVAKNEMGEVVLGTPAVSGDALFIPTDKNLWRVSK